MPLEPIIIYPLLHTAEETLVLYSNRRPQQV